MNGAGAAHVHQPPAEFKRNSYGWGLPCHLSLMNCKSRAESFARSLQGKLRSLSRASGSYDDEQNAENDGAGGNAGSVGDSTVDAQPSSLANTGEFDHLVYDERTHLMTTLNAKDVNRAQNTESSTNRLAINHEDELMFDLGFCSPESSNEIPKHPLTPSPETTSVNGDFDIDNSPHINIENRQYFMNNDYGESGCISSVSSILTEQDSEVENDDDINFECFTSELSESVMSYPKPIASQPSKWWPISAADLSYTLNDVLASDYDSDSIQSPNNLCMCGEPTAPWEKTSSGFLPITNNLQVVLDEGQGAINFENSSKVVDIEDCKVCALADVESGSITLKPFINGIYDMGIDENEQLAIQPFNENHGLANDNLQAEIIPLQCDDCHVEVIDANENNEVDPDAVNGFADKPKVQLSLSELHPEPNDIRHASVEPQTPDDDFPMRVRRSSSLKTGKTPPGTPNRKKIVRFADAMGLDLEDVKTVFLDDLPVVPVSAYKDLEASAYEDDDDSARHDNNVDHVQSVAGHQAARSPFSFNKPKINLVPVFPQPGSLPDFFDRLRRQSVCLESAIVTGCSTIRLVVRVLNLDFNKVVSVRHTSNDWQGFQDIIAEYVDGSNDVFSDKFHTVISSDHLQVGERLCFAVCFKTEGKEYWDNNGGQNYIFQCFPEHDRHLSPPDDSWIHFL